MMMNKNNNNLPLPAEEESLDSDSDLTKIKKRKISDEITENEDMLTCPQSKREKADAADFNKENTSVFPDPENNPQPLVTTTTDGIPLSLQQCYVSTAEFVQSQVGVENMQQISYETPSPGVFVAPSQGGYFVPCTSFPMPAYPLSTPLNHHFSNRPAPPHHHLNFEQQVTPVPLVGTSPPFSAQLTPESQQFPVNYGTPFADAYQTGPNVVVTAGTVGGDNEPIQKLFNNAVKEATDDVIESTNKKMVGDQEDRENTEQPASEDQKSAGEFSVMEDGFKSELDNYMIQTPLSRPKVYCAGFGSTGLRANRTKFTKYQCDVLKEHFLTNIYPKTSLRENIAYQTGLTHKQVDNWFQNKRKQMRDKADQGLVDPMVTQLKPPRSERRSKQERNNTVHCTATTTYTAPPPPSEELLQPLVQQLEQQLAEQQQPLYHQQQQQLQQQHLMAQQHQNQLQQFYEQQEKEQRLRNKQIEVEQQQQQQQLHQHQQEPLQPQVDEEDQASQQQQQKAQQPEQQKGEVQVEEARNSESGGIKSTSKLGGKQSPATVTSSNDRLTPTETMSESTLEILEREVSEEQGGKGKATGKRARGRKRTTAPKRGKQVPLKEATPVIVRQPSPCVPENSETEKNQLPEVVERQSIIAEEEEEGSGGNYEVETVPSIDEYGSFQIIQQPDDSEVVEREPEVEMVTYGRLMEQQDLENGREVTTPLEKL